jgi:hypothetical protein
MQLKCLQSYHTPKRSAEPGDVLSDLSLAEARFLLADAPGCFEVVSASPAERAALGLTEEGEVPTKPFDLSPTGATGPDAEDQARVPPQASVSPEEVQQAAEAVDEQPPTEDRQPADVVFEPAPAFETAVEEEDEETKAPDAPPKDKAVKRAPRQK